MPFGVAGVMAGAAKCFFGFVGFDSIAAAGEEAKNPKRNVPLSIFFTLMVVLAAYVGVSTVLTLILPYYLQVTCTLNNNSSKVKNSVLGQRQPTCACFSRNWTTLGCLDYHYWLCIWINCQVLAPLIPLMLNALIRHLVC